MAPKRDRAAYMREYRRKRKAEREGRIEPPAPVAPAPAAVEDINEAKRRRAVAEADRAEIARDVESGRLVSRETVERNLQRAFGAVRGALDGIPRALAAAVAAEHAPAVRAVAEREVDRVLDGLRVDLQQEEP